MPGTAQKPPMVCSLSSDHSPSVSCLPHFPNLLFHFFLECSAQNRTPGCGMGLGRAWVNGICLPPPSAISHTQKGSHIMPQPPPPHPCTTGRKCLGSGYHGDGSCCLDHSGLPDANRSLQAWQPGTLQASSQAAGAGAALLSLLGVWHCWSYPGALGNKMPLWEPRSYSGSDRPGLNPTSAPWGSVTLNKSPWRALNVLN